MAPVAPIETPPGVLWRSPHNRASAMGLGVALFMVGLTSITYGAQAIVEKAAYGYTGYGIWCGFIFIICGAVGILYAKEPTKDLVSTALVVSMITLLFCFAQMSLAGLALYFNITYTTSACVGCGTGLYCTAWTVVGTCLDQGGWVAVKFCSSLLLTFGAMAFFITTALAVTVGACLMDDKEPEPVQVTKSRPRTPPADLNGPSKKSMVQLPPIFLTLGGAGVESASSRKPYYGDMRAEGYSPLPERSITSGRRDAPIKTELNPMPPIEEADLKARKYQSPILLPLTDDSPV